MSFWLSAASLEFPPLAQALRAPEGLLAIGGDLSAARLLAAYQHGCFPWFSDGQPLLWWSPNPRMVLFPSELHVARSLQKTLRRQTFSVTFDACFERVIRACAAPRTYANSTWITADMQAAYQQLHRMGVAHSVEVWRDGELVGGLYGVVLGRLFFGESMFSRCADASKVAFVTLVERLNACGFVLIDCQMYTEHLARFGARPIPRAEFANYVQRYQSIQGETPWTAGAGEGHER